MISGRRRRLGTATASGVAGVGFGLPCVFGIRYPANTGEVWSFLGFPTYGNGPFERVGIATTVSLLAGFLAVCVVEAVLALAIVHRSTWAARASAALLPIEVAYWIGFALPVGFVLGAGGSSYSVANSLIPVPGEPGLAMEPNGCCPLRPTRRESAEPAARERWAVCTRCGPLSPAGSRASRVTFEGDVSVASLPAAPNLTRRWW